MAASEKINIADSIPAKSDVVLLFTFVIFLSFLLKSAAEFFQRTGQFTVKGI